MRRSPSRPADPTSAWSGLRTAADRQYKRALGSAMLPEALAALYSRPPRCPRAFQLRIRVRHAVGCRYSLVLGSATSSEAVGALYWGTPRYRRSLQLRIGRRHSSKALLVAHAADKAARAVEQALAPIDKLQAAVREARHTRDAVAQTWESSLAALKRGARSGGDDGAPQLYATLFSHSARSAAKSSKVTLPPVSASAPPPPATAAPAA